MKVVKKALSEHRTFTVCHSDSFCMPRSVGKLKRTAEGNQNGTEERKRKTS